MSDREPEDHSGIGDTSRSSRGPCTYFDRKGLPCRFVDGDMLSAIFQQLFPAAKPVTILDSDPAVANATAEALTLCARANGPAAALTKLRQDKVQMVHDGPSLADFPLPVAVREPLDQLIADLSDWRSGKIGWQDVQRGILLYGPPGCGKN